MSKFRLDSYDPVSKSMECTLIRSGPALKGIIHHPPKAASPISESAQVPDGGTSPAKLKEIANDPTELNALSDSAHDLGKAITGDLSDLNSAQKTVINKWVSPSGYKSIQDHLRKQAVSPRPKKTPRRCNRRSWHIRWSKASTHGAASTGRWLPASTTW